MKRNKIGERMLMGLTIGSTVVTVCSLVLVVLYILGKGIPHLTPSLFSFTYNSETVSMLPAILSTLLLVGLTLLIGLPVGIGTAVFLAEYASPTSRLVKIIRLATETLSGIPSIVYGLFGMLFFVGYWKLGYSVLSGGLTMAIMILPLVIRSTEEAILAVPMGYREAAFALGDKKIGVIVKVVLPAAKPGIITGVVLAIGRIVGETAALIYTAGTVAQIPTSLFQSARTLSVHMYALSSEGFHTEEAYATATVLLLLSLLMNLLAGRLEQRTNPKERAN